MMKKFFLSLIVLFASANFCFAFDFDFNSKANFLNAKINYTKKILKNYKKEWVKKFNSQSTPQNQKHEKLDLRTFDFKSDSKNNLNFSKEEKPKKSVFEEKEVSQKTYKRRGTSNFSYDEKYLIYGKYTKELENNYNYDKDAKLNSNL